MNLYNNFIKIQAVFERYPKVKALHHEKNKGYGGAQKTLYENIDIFNSLVLFII